ncbi:MAG: efflux RND transporter permease subunit, partial [Thermoanaerobaculia bacterium]
DEVMMNAASGGAIAIIILLFFLKDPRSTLIIGISIPISIVATFFLMYRTGTSLNIMSLGGLALGVGMLVDNAIVVLEAIFKRREAGAAPFEAARDGASEVGKAVAASTLTTVAVFLPVVFLEGIAAQLFRDMALTVSFSLLASLAVSLTLIPMLAATLGGVEEVAPAHWSGTGPKRGKFLTVLRTFFRFLFIGLPTYVLFGIRVVIKWIAVGIAFISRPFSYVFDGALRRVSEAYPRLLRWALRSRATVLTTALIAFLGAAWLVPRLGFDLIPAFSQGEFSFLVELPEGTPLDITDRFVSGVEEVLAEDDRVASYSSIVGGRGLSLTSTGSEGENTARIQVRMSAGTTPADETEVADILRQRLGSSGLARFKFERPTYFSFRTPIELEVYSDNLKELQQVANTLKNRIQNIPGIVDVKSSAELGNPELQVVFDRNRLAQLGLNLGDVANTLRNKVQGEVATRFTEGDREIDIVVRSVDLGRASIENVQDFIVAQREGIPIYLKSVAEISLVEGPTEIRRIGQKRTGVITGNLSGKDMGTAADDVRSVVSALVMPVGVTATLSGQEEERAEAQHSLLLAMGLAIFLVYLVMASQFESFVHPFVIIFTLPLGGIGVVAALAITGRTINIVAMIGAVMLAGIVVNNAIVLVDAVNQRRHKGVGMTEALIEAGSDRLRPILMTSATTILGLLPMAIGLGAGAELRAPLAITVIGGLSVATLLTLVVIPVVYSLVERKERVLKEELLEARDTEKASTDPIGEFS